MGCAASVTELEKDFHGIQIHEQRIPLGRKPVARTDDGTLSLQSFRSWNGPAPRGPHSPMRRDHEKHVRRIEIFLHSVHVSPEEFTVKFDPKQVAHTA